MENAGKTYTMIARMVEICVAHGVKHVVLSPGSRSAPLALSFMRHKEIKHFILGDERSAAYTALGISKQSQGPVALVCTSGTAALNYAPAIAEAFWSDVPLLVFTADRPPEWIGQADNQSIYQEHIYGRNVKGFFDLPADHSLPDAIWQIERQVNEGIILATHGRKGPVHFNVPLREPLYLTENIPGPERARVIRPYRNENPFAADSLAKDLRPFKKVLFLAGMLPFDKGLFETATQLAGKNNCVLVTDITSNLHGIKNVITYSDLLLSLSNEATMGELLPGLVISFGGPVVSKTLKSFLRNPVIKEHWHIANDIEIKDTFQHLTRIIDADPASCLASLKDYSFDETYFQAWQKVQESIKARLNEGFSKLPWSEPKAVMQVLQLLPEGVVLHLGNSLPIRHATSFPFLENINEIYSNRGVSGIDGSLSAAIGHSMTDDRMHIALIGDMSFLYDRNALWNKYLKGNFKIIILNNYGGRIFESLDAATQPELQEYFVTEQSLNFEYTARQHDISYSSVETGEELLAILPEFFTPSARPGILELRFKENRSIRQVKEILLNL